MLVKRKAIKRTHPVKVVVDRIACVEPSVRTLLKALGEAVLEDALYVLIQSSVNIGGAFKIGLFLRRHKDVDARMSALAPGAQFAKDAPAG